MPTLPPSPRPGSATGSSPRDAADELARLITAYVDGEPAVHAVVSGGFGSGKSHALGIAALAASASGARVAWLERGPIGISSYEDILSAVRDALGARDTESSVVDEEQIVRGDGVHRLVIVVEGLDQLIRQLRAADRPRLRALLEAPDGPVVIGSSVGAALGDEFAAHFRVFATVPVPGIEDGVALALARATRHRITSPRDADLLSRDAARADAAVRSSPLFWSIVGSHAAVSVRGAIDRAESDLRALVRAHFDALLLRIAPSEQRVLVEIARSGAPRTVQEVADGINVRNQAAASALARLHSDGWVVSPEPPAGADRRRTWYDIADPLLRLHLRPDRIDSVGDLIRALVETWRRDEPEPRPVSSDDDLRIGAQEAIHRGSSGEPGVAGRWFRDALLEHIETAGPRADSTLDALWEWGVWTGEAGERQRAQRILEHAFADDDGALSRRDHLAWNLMELGRFADAQAISEETLERAERAGAVAVAAHARQNLGRALGEQGDPAAAVQHMTRAVQDMRDLAAHDAPGSWDTPIRRARHGLAYWTARSGRAAEAAQDLAALAAEPGISDHDRHHVRLDLAEVRAGLDPDTAPEEFARLAADIEASGIDIDLARAARHREFVLAAARAPAAPSAWPSRDLAPEMLASTVGDMLDDGRLDLDGLADVVSAATPAQARAMMAALVATQDPLSPGVRAARATVVARALPSAPERRLLGDLAEALRDDPSAEANLPEEWRELLAEMRQRDAAARGNRPSHSGSQHDDT